jgi:NADPH-dependent 2,4-dienoyl-CoA reductase/sulfur reductase-like enzyme
MRLERFIKGNETPRKNVHVLRTVDQGPIIHSACIDKRVAIVGSSFIGVETAAAIIGVAKSVVVIGMEAVPFERVLGLQVGGILQKMHEQKKVQFKLNAICSEFKISEDDTVHTIILKDGSEIPCDVVIIGAGVSPATNFIEGKSIQKHQDQSLICDVNLATGAPGLYAAGDLARFPMFFLNEYTRIEHWGFAQTMARIAAKNMVNATPTPLRSVPVFWTASYGKSVRYAGHGIGVDQILLDTFGQTEMDTANPKFIAYYCRGGIVIAVSSMNADPVVSDFACLLESNYPLYMNDLIGQVKEGTSQQFVHNALKTAASSNSSKKTN